MIKITRTDAMDFISIGDYILSLPCEVKFETFNDPNNCYGIVFTHHKTKFQVVHSKLGTRLLINGGEGDVRDLPFNLDTAYFLPDFVTVDRVKPINNNYTQNIKTREEFIKVAEKIIKELKSNNIKE